MFHGPFLALILKYVNRIHKRWRKEGFNTRKGACRKG